jgi:hypothetical protein
MKFSQSNSDVAPVSTFIAAQKAGCVEDLGFK